MKRYILILIATLCLMKLVSCVSINIQGVSQVRHKETREVVVEHVSQSPIRVRTSNGGVTVVVDPQRDDVLIKAVVTGTGSNDKEASRRLKQAKVQVDRDETGRLVIGAHFEGKRRSGEGMVFTITLPDVRGVNIETTNGRVSVAGSTGVLVARSSNGSVDIKRHVGVFDVKTSNGSITAHQVDGRALLRSSNGSIDLRLVDGVTEPFTMKSSNGALRATVGADFVGRVTVDKSHGSVLINDPHHRISHRAINRGEGHVLVGEGAGVSDSMMDTSNGKITLTVR